MVDVSVRSRVVQALQNACLTTRRRVTCVRGSEGVENAGRPRKRLSVVRDWHDSSGVVPGYLVVSQCGVAVAGSDVDDLPLVVTAIGGRWKPSEGDSKVRAKELAVLGGHGVLRRRSTAIGRRSIAEIFSPEAAAGACNGVAGTDRVSSARFAVAVGRPS